MIAKSFVLLLSIVLFLGVFENLAFSAEESVTVLEKPQKSSIFSFIKLRKKFSIREKRSKALAHYMMGIIYDNKGKVNLAISEYRKSLKYNPNLTLPRLRLGADYLFLGQEEKAFIEFKLIIKLEPENSQARLLLALIYTSRGDFEKAGSEYKKIIEYNPDDLRALSSLADIFVIEEKMLEAKKIYEKLLLNDPENAILHFNLGMIYNRLKDFDGAMLQMDKTIKFAPKYIGAYIVRAKLLEEKALYNKAIDSYKKALKIDPLNKSSHFSLAKLYYNTGKKSKAINQYKILMSIAPNNIAGYIALSHIYVKEKKYDQAIELLKQAEKIKETAFIYFYKGALYERMAREGISSNEENLEELAVQNLKKAIEIDSKLSEAYNYLGYMYAENNKNLDEAIFLIETALKLSPNNPAYLDSLGWTYFKKGMTKEAIEKLEKAVSIKPDDPVIRGHLGDAYFNDGAFDKARYEWEESLKLDPKKKDIKEKLKLLKRNLRKE